MNGDPVINCFEEEFERFFGLLEQQIDACPEELWEEEAGGFPYWQHLFHVFVCMEFYALREGEESKQNIYPYEVVMLSARPERAIGKEELRRFAGTMKALVRSFIARQTVSTLLELNPVMTAWLGKKRTNQHALIGIIRHACYHLGCCDSFLREHTGKGVY